MNVKLIFLLALLLIACQSTIEQQPVNVNVPTKQGAVTVHTGMPKDSVLWTLGVPPGHINIGTIDEKP